MSISSAILAAVLLLSSLASASPASPPSKIPALPTKRQEPAAPSATIDAKRYFHNCKGYLEREKEAWDDANTLAKAALNWQPGGNFQPDADLYLVAARQILQWSTAYRNAVAVHGRNWIWPEASLDVWCWQNGTDGFPPRPDEAKEPWQGGCDPETFAYSYIRKHAYWFHRGYTIVFCPRFWSTIDGPRGKKLQGKFPLKTVLGWGKEFDRVASNPDYLALNRAQTYLHELMHLDGLVSTPVVEDLVYGAPNCAGLAMIYGTASKQEAPSFPQLKGEWGTSRNADSYAFFANSIYFREQLQQQEPPIPTGKWKETATFVVGPRQTDPTAALGINGQPPDIDDDGIISMVGIFDETMDNEDVPVYEPPPPPPACAPSNTGTDPSLFNNLAAVFCGKLVPGVAAVHVLGEKNLDPPVANAKIKAKFGFLPSSGENTLGCGLSCIDTYTNMTSTCQTNSHTLTGKAQVTMGCGTWEFEIED